MLSNGVYFDRLHFGLYKTKYTSSFSGSTACHWGSTLKRKTFKLIYPQNCTLVPLSSNMPSTMNMFRVNKVQRCSFKGASDKLLYA